jgi:uncharacterized protein (DUF362 family)
MLNKIIEEATNTMHNKIYLEKRDCYNYPSSDSYYSPHIHYPEYPFSEDTLSPYPNEVYDMVRTSLFGLGLDTAHYGSKQMKWNPLGDYVKSGATILLKPNWVNNTNLVGGLDCTVTHPSIIRCVIDYCIIAEAKVIEVGDAPIQDCDFNDLMEKHGYNHVFKFFSNRGINILVTDFRRTVSKVVSKMTDKIFLQERNRGFNSEAIEFDLQEFSHFDTINVENKYGCINYTDSKVNELHRKGKHKYLIHKSIFDADLIINLPKPKTHRFAGITGAQKNFIGICSDKEYLPHFRHGIPEKGGDESKFITIFGRLYSMIDRQRCKFIETQNIFMQFVLCSFQYLILSLKKIFSKKESVNGLWYGNDTIWRTILDINLILLYGNSNGELNFKTPARNIISIGDLIIAGERSGPLKPSPKPLGIILASNNCALFDYVFCDMTGFDRELIPTVKNSMSNKLLLQDMLSGIQLNSNIKALNGLPIENIVFPDEWRFIPNPSWSDVLT